MDARSAGESGKLPIEDDMTLPDEVKQQMLRTFHERVVTPGWHFAGSGPNEKDRQVLVDFADVIVEVRILDYT